jgi:Tfp pilus assembly protein PilV
MVRNRRGLALLDVIVGSAMLAVGLAVVISMSSRSLVRQVNAEQQITASWLADETLAMILIVGPDEYEKTYPDRGRFDPPFESFYFEIEIEDESLYMPVKAVATISWDAVGGSHSIHMETMIARRHGDLVARIPAEPVNREERYWDAIDARAAR